MVEKACTIIVQDRAKAVTPSSKLYELFPDFSLAFFRLLKVKFRSKRDGKSQQKNQTKICKHTKRHNFLCYDKSKDENPQRENEMDSSSFECLHAQLDCKLRTVIKIKHW